LGSNSNETELTKTIIQVINEKKPQNVKQLANLVKEKLAISEEEILQSILELQSQGRIKLEDHQPTPPPTRLAAYVKTGQALWYWATITIAIITSATVFTVPEDFYPWVYIRYALGAIFVLCLKVYACIKALFPARVPIKMPTESLDTVERIALSLGMSLALVPIVGLLLNYTPWGIRLTPIVTSLLALTLVFATAAIIREPNEIKKQV